MALRNPEKHRDPLRTKTAGDRPYGTCSPWSSNCPERPSHGRSRRFESAHLHRSEVNPLTSTGQRLFGGPPLDLCPARGQRSPSSLRRLAGHRAFFRSAPVFVPHSSRDAHRNSASWDLTIAWTTHNSGHASTSSTRSWPDGGWTIVIPADCLSPESSSSVIQPPSPGSRSWRDRSRSRMAPAANLHRQS